MGFGEKITKALFGESPVKAINTFNTPFTLPASSFVPTASPIYRDLSNVLFLLKCYSENPIVQAIINIKAEAFANIMFSVRDLKSGEILPLEQYKADGGKLHDLISRPNPMQSTYEWLRQLKVNREVFGNSYSYASVPSGYQTRFTYRDINVVNNMPSYCITPVTTGQWMEATTKEEIVSRYEYRTLDGKKKDIETNQIFHTNNVNIRSDVNFTEGISNLVALRAPISNIDAAYESRNVLATKRGALGILTSDMRDEMTGTLPMDDKQIAQVQQAFAKYGLMNDQYQQIISPIPLNYQKMAMSVKELMLFEEVESNAIAVATSYGVPELLAKYYLKGGTFNNLDASEKRLYDSTIIPESKDFMIGINSFFKTREEGIELIGSFDHLHVLQVNRMEEAKTKKLTQETARQSFMMGATKYKDYLVEMEMPEDTEIGELRVWDLEDKQLRALGINTNTKPNETEQ